MMKIVEYKEERVYEHIRRRVVLAKRRKSAGQDTKNDCDEIQKSTGKDTVNPNTKEDFEKI